MTNPLRLRHALIVCFCLWHMFAVAAYLLPRHIEGSVGSAFRTAGMTSAPYVLLLSQWQKWDIFAPDPMRKSSKYRIDRDAGDRWETVMVMDLDHLGFFERAKEIKILERMETNEWKALVTPYIRSLCSRIPDSGGSELRLVSVWNILPKDLSSLKRLSQEHLTTSENVLGSYRCKRDS